jgi:signal transduction histidine kinase
MTAMRPDAWLRIAGFATWLVCGLLPLLAVSQGQLAGTRAVAWSAAFAVFGLAYISSCTIGFYQRRARALQVVLLALEAVAGLVMLWTTPDGIAGATLVIVSGQLPWVFPVRVAAVWIAIQTILLMVPFAQRESLALALTLGGGFAGFQLFALATASLTLRESRAREDLERTNAELQAAHSLLAETSRMDERLRVARDLHDTIGHHLTALSLNLDVASRLAEGTAAARIREAHAIAKLLLSDVRDVVSRTRENHIDLGEALRALTVNSTLLQVHLDVQAGLDVDDPSQAHALLRCVQEIITNAARHADARNLWIRLERQKDGVSLDARDDGRGADALAVGNGLRGMRERFERYAGRIEFTPGPGRGFEVHGFMPWPEAAA